MGVEEQNGGEEMPWGDSTSFVELTTDADADQKTLVLVAERTKRKDPLSHFKQYTGGWNISNKHYWAVRLSNSYSILGVKSSGNCKSLKEMKLSWISFFLPIWNGWKMLMWNVKCERKFIYTLRNHPTWLKNMTHLWNLVGYVREHWWNCKCFPLICYQLPMNWILSRSGFWFPWEWIFNFHYLL